MQLHIGSAFRHLEAPLAVSLTGMTRRAAISLDKSGDTRLVIESPQEGARLMHAVFEAISLMTAARAPLPVEGTPEGFPWCPDKRCELREHGKDVRHRAPGEREGDPDITWTDPEPYKSHKPGCTCAECEDEYNAVAAERARSAS